MPHSRTENCNKKNAERTRVAYSFSPAAIRSPFRVRAGAAGATLLWGDVISAGMFSGMRRIERPLLLFEFALRRRSSTLSSSEDLMHFREGKTFKDWTDDATGH